MTARNVLATLGLSLLIVGLLGPPASAGSNTPVVVADPRGDGNGNGDILGFRIDQTGGYIVLQVRTRLPLETSVAPAWTDVGSDTALRFSLATSPGSPAVDWVVRLTPGPSGPVGQVSGVASPPGRAVECVTVTQPQATIIRAAVAMSCLPGVGQARAIARYRLDRGGDGTIDSVDRAPNRGWSPNVDFLQ